MASDATTAERSWQGWKALLADERLPAAVVDLDAVDANLRTLLAARRRPDVGLRLATKSLRVPEVLRYLLERGAGAVRGLMTFSAVELLHLADAGFDDLLAGYPVGRPEDARVFAHLAARGITAVAMVDSPEHLALLAAAARERSTTVPVCIDVDASLRLLGAHLGVRRSPLRSAEAVATLADRAAETGGLGLVGLMAYEAQVAGVADRHAGLDLEGSVRRWVKRTSVRRVAKLRAAVCAELAARGHTLGLVNGGGSGSVASTSADPSVTEVTIGSGLYCPTLFDGYDGLPLEPAAFFALPVVRRSDPAHVTCMGGGYPASGPAGADRLPSVHLPRGLEALPLEGFGEVQTPLRVTDPAVDLALGDPVVCRHAKSGELLRAFSEVLLVRGDRVVGRAPTYRGLGLGVG